MQASQTPTTSSVVPQRRLKKNNRHLWPLYGEAAVLFVLFGVFLATYKGK